MGEDLSKRMAEIQHRIWQRGYDRGMELAFGACLSAIQSMPASEAEVAIVEMMEAARQLSNVQ